MSTGKTAGKKRALLLVDLQQDFCEGGALAVAGGAAVAEAAAAHLEAHGDEYAVVVATADSHLPESTNGGHFAPPGEEPDFGATWPPHCVEGTPGQLYHPAVAAAVEARGVGGVHHVVKGRGEPAYSAFEGWLLPGDSRGQGKRLEELLKSEGVEEVVVCGLALDYCVLATALDSVSAGFPTAVLLPLTASVGSPEPALQKLRAAGVTLLEELPGGEPTPPEGEPKPEGYDPGSFPPFAVTADLCVFTLREGLLQVLLVERGGEPFKGRWALPGGFTGPEESTEEAAQRELAEETGLDLLRVEALQEGGELHLEQLKTYSSPRRDPRMRVVTVAYVVLAADLPDPVAGDDAAGARWWPVEDLLGEQAEVELAFDHRKILEDAVDRVRSKLEYTTLATQFVGPSFTLSDLWRVYRAVWGVEPPLANFRRKVLSVEGFVEPLQEYSVGGPGPRALLYRRGAARFMSPPLLRSRALPEAGDSPS